MLSLPSGKETALIFFLLLGGVVAGVSIAELPVAPVEEGSTTAAPADVHVDAQQLTYSGSDVDGLYVVVNNTRSVSANVTVTAALKNASGTTVATGTTAVTVEAGTATRATVSLDRAVSPAEYAIFEVTVTE